MLRCVIDNFDFRLHLIEYILKNYNKGFTVTVRQLDITSNENYRPQLRRVKQSKDKNIVICSSIEALPEILKQAQQVGLMTDEHQFIITSLDMHTIDLEPFQYSGANITGLRLVVPEDSLVKSTTDFFKDVYIKKNLSRKRRQDQEEEDEDEEIEVGEDEEIPNEDDESAEEMPHGLTAEGLQVSTALTYDAVLLFSHILSEHQGLGGGGVLCDRLDSIFVNGTSIFNAMKTITPLKGLSGEIQFDQHGNRENFQLDVLELASDGLQKVGTWNASKGIQSIRGKVFDGGQGDPNTLRNKTLLVLTVIVSLNAFLKLKQLN